MFFIYGALGSKACERSEILLHTIGQDYRFYVYGRDFTLNQLQRIVPGATSVPQIFHGTKYIGGIKDLYEYIYTSEGGANSEQHQIKEVKEFLDTFFEKKPE